MTEYEVIAHLHFPENVADVRSHTGQLAYEVRESYRIHEDMNNGELLVLEKIDE